MPTKMEWYDRLNSNIARQMALRRISLMTDFVAQAHREIAAGSE